MQFGKFARVLAPVAAIALATALSGCDGMKFSFGDGDGKPLSELDLTDKAPTELVLAGPDEVRVTLGDKLAITVEGDAEATEGLRFSVSEDSIAISRNDGWNSKGKSAVVNITMPAPREITLAGSGRITSAVLAREAEVTIAGSGRVDTPGVAGDKLELTIAGSGSYRAAGNVARLEVTVAGSGDAEMGALRTDRANVTIAGSGDAVFASDGEVDAEIMGSGEVRVIGRARCQVSATGSGRLVCEPGPEAGPAAAAPEAPEAPEAPKT